MIAGPELFLEFSSGFQVFDGLNVHIQHGSYANKSILYFSKDIWTIST